MNVYIKLENKIVKNKIVEGALVNFSDISDAMCACNMNVISTCVSEIYSGNEIVSV